MPRESFQKVLVVGLESITSMRIPVKDSFSKLVEGKPQARITATSQGKSVSYNEPSSSTIDDFAPPGCYRDREITIIPIIPIRQTNWARVFKLSRVTG
jgi:hypothetical protein